MKKLLTLRNCLICCGSLFGLVAFILAAVCGATFTVSGFGGTSSTLYQNVVFGNGKDYGAAVLPLIGAILVLVGVLCAVVVGFFGDKFLKDAKVRKVLLLVAAAFVLLGGVFLFFIKGANASAWAAKSGGTKEDYLSVWSHGKYEAAGIIIAGVLAVLGGLSICASQFVKSK